VNAIPVRIVNDATSQNAANGTRSRRSSGTEQTIMNGTPPYIAMPPSDRRQMRRGSRR
jgi:hypothetical protein